MNETTLLDILHSFERHQMRCRQVVTLADRLLAVPGGVVGDDRATVERWQADAAQGVETVGASIQLLQGAIAEVSRAARVH
jgi:hypothetical protein